MSHSLKTSVIQFRLPVPYWLRKLIACWVIHIPYFASHDIHQLEFGQVSHVVKFVLSQSGHEFPDIRGSLKQDLNFLVPFLHLIICSRHSLFLFVSNIPHLKIKHRPSPSPPTPCWSAYACMHLQMMRRVEQEYPNCYVLAHQVVQKLSLQD